jgi:hypothetical protein
MDRLSRSVVDGAGLMERAAREGWAPHFADHDIDTSTRAGEMAAANIIISGSETSTTTNPVDQHHDSPLQGRCQEFDSPRLHSDRNVPAICWGVSCCQAYRPRWWNRSPSSP